MFTWHPPCMAQKGLLYELQMSQLRQFQVGSKELIQILGGFKWFKMNPIFLPAFGSGDAYVGRDINDYFKYFCIWAPPAPHSPSLIELKDTFGHIQHGAAMPQLRFISPPSPGLPRLVWKTQKLKSKGQSPHFGTNVQSRISAFLHWEDPGWLKMPLVIALYSCIECAKEKMIWGPPDSFSEETV